MRLRSIALSQDLSSIRAVRWTPPDSQSTLRLIILLCGMLLAPFAHAAKHKHPPKAAVELIAAGKVVHAGTPVDGAVVYLEDPKSLAIKSYLTSTGGAFHFSNLSPQTDYEVWAEQNGVESKHRFISQFSSHTKFIFVLKLQAQKKHKLLGVL